MAITSSTRFVNTPELVHRVLMLLAVERVDLLTLAAVNRTLRIQALRVWARYQDIVLPFADRRLRFFEHHPELLPCIRYLRIRSHYTEREHEQQYLLKAHLDGFWSRWREITALLRLIGDAILRVNATPPALDVSVQFEEVGDLMAALRRHPALLQRICALRLLDVPDPHNLPARAGLSSRWTRNCDDLVDLIDHILTIARTNETLSLHVLHFIQTGDQTNRQGEKPIWNDIPRSLWDRLRDLCSMGLEDLGLRILAPVDLEGEPNPVNGTLRRLTSATVAFQMQEITRRLLEGNDQMERLYIENGAGGGVYDKTFKNLRWLAIDSVINFSGDYTPPEYGQEFPKRHQDLIGLTAGVDSIHCGLRDFPKLRYIHGSLFEYYGSTGITLHTLPPHVKTSEDLGSLRLALDNHPGLGERVTCLELSTWNDLSGHVDDLHALFGSDRFPVLVELSLTYQSGGTSLRSDPANKNPLSAASPPRIMAALTTARSMRVLQLRDTQPLINAMMDHLCQDFDSFPPALEYFACGCLSEDDRVRYYRFLPIDTPKENDTAREASVDEFEKRIEAVCLDGGGGGGRQEARGKRGRLQYIPSMFRVRITSEGVWEKDFDPNEGQAILDHVTHPEPELVLS
ncbi:hypothetical protein OC846_002926 [Tilletia horrida]|uniref:Uncharacterized protein n=1 Tax=Tilletia horrida TaxID=155126 RepID=A0AAN6GT37_9BASI|nr:hypothetical protein OC846_002926 [Tilletia horrida]KAK0552987.1 hypothetical protein OC845_001406 [Tilletia horrida]KAK0566893.1 hypothetical protein OC861_003015 [Tilletia horrida]